MPLLGEQNHCRHTGLSEFQGLDDLAFYLHVLSHLLRPYIEKYDTETVGSPSLCEDSTRKVILKCPYDALDWQPALK